jgi:hypothetical protein
MDQIGTRPSPSEEGWKLDGGLKLRDTYDILRFYQKKISRQKSTETKPAQFGELLLDTVYSQEKSQDMFSSDCEEYYP